MKTAEEIAKDILYLPCTNGQDVNSIALGIGLIESYAIHRSKQIVNSRVEELQEENKQLRKVLNSVDAQITSLINQLTKR